MDGGTLALALGLLAVLMALRVPVAFSLVAAGAAGLLLHVGPDTTAATLATEPYAAMASYSLLVVPMFILMGLLVLHARLAEDLFALTSRLLRWLPGGLAIATIGACAGFAAVTGSSVATVATMGRISVTEMERYGYSRRFAAGVVGASGTLGVLIPPSIVLVLFGIVTGESVGRLLIAGIIPGVISALAYAVLVGVLAYRRAELLGSPTSVPVEAGVAALGADHGGAAAARATSADAAASTTDATGEGAGAPAGRGGAVTGRHDAQAGGQRPTAGLGAGLQVLAVFLVVVGGIYSGYFTASESGAVGAFVALCLLIARNGRALRRLLERLRAALQETMSLTAMAFAILLGATIFSQFLVVARVPSGFASFVGDLDVAPILVVALLLAMLVPLGMVLDSFSIIVIAGPLLYGPITELGFSGIWFGIMMVKFIELGLVTPPVGMNAYVVAGTVEGLRVEDVFRGLLPMIMIDVAVIALLFAFPGIVTWLPDRMM
jgi:C4-dicarboxylate transporter, DctM subunit